MLFDPEPADGDHHWYATLRASEVFPEFREWCQATYDSVAEQLDKDFPERFRHEMPQRISELFFAHAFAKAGWKPAARAPGFDFAYKLANGRLLVEVTTPSEQTDDTYEKWESEGVTGFHYDDKSMDAALLRVTGGFCAKAAIAAERISKGLVREDDYVVVAISGLQVTQKTPVRLEIGGDVPDFARAFLPIGPLIAVATTGGAGTQWTYRHEFSGEIAKPEGRQPVKRSAFLDDRFAHVHAVAFSPLDALGVERSTEQTGVLHNPCAKWDGERPNLGMGNEYEVVVEDEGFRLIARQNVRTAL